MAGIQIVRKSTRRDASFSRYMNEIAKNFPLHPDEEINLITKIREGDEKSLEKLIKGNLKFVVSVAKNYQDLGIPLSDLINEGNIGLIKAVKKFDETKGFKFISYAVWWIRQSILQSLSEDARMVRFPQNKISMRKKINKYIETFEQDYQREPTPEELSELTEINSNTIKIVLEFSNTHYSLDEPLNEGEDANRLDIFKNDNAPPADCNIKKEFIKESIDFLLESITDPRGKQIIILFFGLGDYEPMRLPELANLLGLHPERVRQIKKETLREMKNAYKKRYGALDI